MGGKSSYGDDSPIAAFATTPGSSALTLIRCSGKGAIELAASIFSPPEKLLQAAGNTATHGWIVAHNGEQLVDEVIASVFRAPKSYSGEDSLDITCHGGSAAGAGVMAALREAGFRDALPGEFTFRAFMNGKLDLTRCESVMEMVSAKTDISRCHAVSRLSGVLENEINAIKKQLLQALSGVEIFLDYSEDEISADADEAAGIFAGEDLAREALTRLRKLAKSWQNERIYQEGILAVIAGRPNAGKSSLFNLLIKEERSIVTEVPGTTRDWIEAWVSIGGIPIRFADTAGLRDSLDPVEKIGVERSKELLESADLVLYLIDGAAGLGREDAAFIGEYRQGAKKKPLLALWNKADIAPPSKKSEEFLEISAKTGEGMAELAEAIIKAAGILENSGDSPELASLGTIRQKNLAETAAAMTEEALELAGRGEPLDLIAPFLREAVNALGEITGEVSTANILEEMFSKFCVGK
ncbi:MAG: tRNA uridine-5-carboxymethylaminomethyl(34) synthesis GTPase MnmE [Treponema sp.]|jgi:tRNA modification GTPase|nr:tRNA uridine-5-carboxymethylaminomethyl(34) synthesis GTPase MnmE [Treponema sp.]